MIAFSSVSKQYGRQLLFVEASFQLNPGEKVGLVGPNGSGKTTLFRMITGEETPDEGDISVPKKLTIGYFRQDDDLGNVDRDGNGDCDCRDRGETCRGEALTHYWTQLFGRRDDFHPLVIAGERHATASAAVELYLYAPAWAREMRLRNDGETWSAWRPFAPRVSWTLAAGDGPRTVFSEVGATESIHRACDRIWLTGAGPPEESAEPVACEDDGTFRAGEP